MAKNKKVMSIAIEPELQKEIINYSKRKGMSTSAYIGMIMQKALKISINEDPVIVGKSAEEDVTTIMLKIPCKLKGQRDALKSWMDTQTSRIVNKLG